MTDIWFWLNIAVNHFFTKQLIWHDTVTNQNTTLKKVYTYIEGLDNPGKPPNSEEPVDIISIQKCQLTLLSPPHIPNPPLSHKHATFDRTCWKDYISQLTWENLGIPRRSQLCHGFKTDLHSMLPLWCTLWSMNKKQYLLFQSTRPRFLSVNTEVFLIKKFTFICRL